MPSERLNRLRQHMAETNTEAVLITDLLNVRYLSGYTGSSGRLLITMGKSYIISDSRYELQCAIECPDFDLELMITRWEISAIGLIQVLNLSSVAFEAESVTYAEWKMLSGSLPNARFVPADGYIASMRLIKDAAEIGLIRRAARIADRAFAHIIDFLKPGISEKELSAEIDCELRRCGADKESFDTIAISGPRTALIHGQPSDRIIKDGDLVLMDFGAFYDGYTSDITRTVVAGNPTEMQRSIYNIVLEAQTRAIESIKPGKSGCEIDAIARGFFDQEGMGERFGHSLGHGLGLDIHDSTAFSKSSNLVLKPGMVATVEPGIYIPDWGGIRIEDDIIVTEAGCETITHSPKQLTIS